MRGTGRLGFVLPEKEVTRDILVPHYYDPRIAARLAELGETHDLLSVGSLIEEGDLELRQGNYIGKIHYGSGTYPYIRTSDIANWELRGSPKQGVSQAVYDQWASKQDVRPGDVLLVHEGTYLIGTSAYVTSLDHSFLFQHHLAKLRSPEGSRIPGPLLAALLTAPIVQAQIRSKQFTADIIDSIVGRLLEVVLPVPRNPETRAQLSSTAERAYEERAAARVVLSRVFGGLDEMLARGKWLGEDTRDDFRSFGAVLGGWSRARSFVLKASLVKNDILMARYYDPVTTDALKALAGRCDLVSVGELADSGTLSLATGHEVGKLAYGTGTIPFVRTSDLGNWELKRDPKQLVSQAIYDTYAAKQSVSPRDILLVRDGTYLVGNTAMVTDSDLPMLFSGGIYRIRAKASEFDPFLLLALLNSTTVRQQIRNKQFTRDVIDTIGRRLREVVLPLPRSPELCRRIADFARTNVVRRAEVRQRLSRLGAEIEQIS